MRVFEFHNQVRLPTAIDETFEFFADAHNLERLTPPVLRFEVLTPSPIEMRIGTLIDYRLRVRGVPLRWRSEITAWEPPYRFVDEQRNGPYSLWVHEHTFRAEDGGTLAEDHLQYAVPGGVLINRLFVAGDVRKIFEFRNRRLLQILGGKMQNSISNRFVTPANAGVQYPKRCCQPMDSRVRGNDR